MLTAFLFAQHYEQSIVINNAHYLDFSSKKRIILFINNRTHEWIKKDQKRVNFRLLQR